jgi:hypothetical protein
LNDENNSGTKPHQPQFPSPGGTRQSGDGGR